MEKDLKTEKRDILKEDDIIFTNDMKRAMKESGHHVTYYIDRFTAEEITGMLKDEMLTLNDIATRLHFNSMRATSSATANASSVSHLEKTEVVSWGNRHIS